MDKKIVFKTIKITDFSFKAPQKKSVSVNAEVQTSAAYNNNNTDFFVRFVYSMRNMNLGSDIVTVDGKVFYQVDEGTFDPSMIDDECISDAFIKYKERVDTITKAMGVDQFPFPDKVNGLTYTTK